MRSTGRRLLPLVIAGFGIAMMLASPAAAGGPWMSPVLNYYEPGDTVVIIGYTEFDVDETFYGTMQPMDDDGVVVPGSEPTVVGEITVQPTDLGGYASYRVSISFVLPAGLAEGWYRFGICTETCDIEPRSLGGLAGTGFGVGIEFVAAHQRLWHPTEPEIANMEPDGLINLVTLGAERVISAQELLAEQGVEMTPTTLHPPPPTSTVASTTTSTTLAAESAGTTTVTATSDEEDSAASRTDRLVIAAIAVASAAALAAAIVARRRRRG